MADVIVDILDGGGGGTVSYYRDPAVDPELYIQRILIIKINKYDIRMINK